jgi:quinoprotein glucose dehydrogenase
VDRVRYARGEGEIAGTPYGMARRFLRSPSGSPCSPPPWGTLNAIDVDTAKVKWTVPVGQMPGAPPSLGSLSLGGPIVTAGGLIFMAGRSIPRFAPSTLPAAKNSGRAHCPPARVPHQ